MDELIARMIVRLGLGDSVGRALMACLRLADRRQHFRGRLGFSIILPTLSS